MRFQGLSSAHAEQLLKRYGLNSIEAHSKRTILQIFLEQFNNFLTLLLIGAAFISIATHETVDGILILMIVFLNAMFGLYQELRAEKSLDSLKKVVITKTRVIRDGKQEEIESKFLVPGDIVFIEEGTKVPADGIILKSVNLQFNESALTGESLPIDKKETEKIYMGTIVARGRGFFRVEKTAMKTKFGQIASSMTEIKKYKTPLQKKLEDTSKVIGYIGITASIIVFILSLAQTGDYFLSFLLAVALAVAVVPEGLPAVLTITLSLGVAAMAKKKAIIRKLASIEALGSITVLATDKTGTLTTNEMKVKEVFINNSRTEAGKLSINGEAGKLLLQNSILCSTASLSNINGQIKILGDPTEGALLILAQNKGLSIDSVRTEWKVLKENSFNSKKKKMSVVVENSERLRFTKGAPESILKNCERVLVNNKVKKLTKENLEMINKVMEKWASAGLRVLAFSYNNSRERKDIFLGIVAMHDPPRIGIENSVDKAMQAGIKVLIITGDNEKTAKTIGKITHVYKNNQKILSGDEVDNMNDEELKKVLPSVSIFARTTPFHKHRIVKLFQELGEVVAVTGDGINDSIALKQADVGIAMGKTGTDVAKDSADIVILDDNFETIVNAIEEGRNITKNLKNAIKYLLSCNVSEALSLISALALGISHLFYPIQLLYINLVTDGAPALALAFSPKQKNLMHKKPQKKQTLLKKGDKKFIVIVGLLATFIVLSMFFLLNRVEGTTSGKTAAFTVLTLIQSFIFLDMWLNNRLSLKGIALLKKPIFITSFLIPFVLQYIIVSFPAISSLFKINTLGIKDFLMFTFAAFAILPLLKIISLFELKD